MTYKEFINWAIDNDIVLGRYEIYPDRYTNVPFASGCYRDEEGFWCYYHSIDERTSLTPDGTRMTENECFNNLLGDLKYSIEKEKESDEAYSKEFKQSCEALTEEERNKKVSARNARLEEKRIVNIYMPRNQFAKSQDEIVIDLNRIFERIDSNTEDNALYVEINQIYRRLYCEEVATKLFKIFKYEEKFARYIEDEWYGKKYIMIFDEVRNSYQIFKEEVNRETSIKDSELVKTLEEYERNVFDGRFQILRKMIKEGKLGE